ncbi:hypothetical protein HYPBUDRAFT_147356 [Hyphopichia burtonii NRRL Y-1933]|uniref:Eukaryotic peptide chain release factor GTP-binding subunit n=1 Tax=Hyphopichia burtonii NRRL Y-1933 TaxID=984485 RepID=A0A1E4RNG9_9ASCO|nr:hypothetical protein HYPBUDRAFT_147356 [Hyphopichia burtonii NRRL Y-1933]ODV68820.1 hypothetical protein HYPBUDRAFT_147356 [Hyphopichia burtonii NRRL Y-1933]
MSDQQQEKLNQDFQNASIEDQQGQGAAPQAYVNPAAAPSFVPQQGYQQYQGYQGYQQGGYQNFQPQGYQQYQPQGYQQYQQGGYQNFNNTRGGYSNNRGGYNNNRGGYNNNRGGYQNYNSYNNYNNYNNQYQPQGQPYQPQQQQPAAGMSLADFQKQQSASNLNKPKKTLKLAGSSSIKLANATKDVAKEDKPKAETKSETATPEAPAATEAPAKEAAKETPAKEAAKETTPVPSKESTPAPSTKESTPSASSMQKSSSSKSNNKKESTPTTQTTDQLIKEQEDEVDEEVVNDMFGGKDHVSIIFMGHVDAGKSTMGGNILYLTGSVDKRTVDKYEREAKDAGRQGWYLSWIMDTNKEERNDGKTIEVGKAYFETDKRRYTILDAPGHKTYVSEMIGGASQADVGILVISARKGEYETGFEKGGQTREHALLAKTQGVNKIVVVVNKMDDATVAWSEDRYKDCTTKLGLFLKGIGYAKEDILFMPVSGYTGAGLKDRVDPKDCPWYSGPSLLEFLDEMKTVNRHINAPFMLPISGKMKDMGTLVEGKIESGHIKKNGSLLLMPNRTSIEVVTIYNETEQECDAAYCGEQVRLKIKGVEEEDLQAGYVLTSPKNPVKTVTKFEAQIAIVELKSILSNGFSCVMHLHTAIEEVTFTELKHKLEKGTNRKSKKPPAFAKKGMKIIAVLEMEEAVCAETYGDYPQLGRFTLRDQGTTIAIGKITKILK